MTLQDFFKENPKAALCFSGGVDSSYLLYAALQWGEDIAAYYVKSAFQPAFELADARRLADGLNARLTVIEADILADEAVTSNPADRCYHCKGRILTAIRRQAAADGYALLIDGNNASDDTGDRPGMRAVEEQSVRSPLRECGLAKSDVRRLSKAAGLFTWDKPAYACLATRIPTGRAITGALLGKVEAAENALFALGYRDFRVRVIGDAARLQLRAEDMARAVSERAAVAQAITPDFSAVLLDLDCR